MTGDVEMHSRRARVSGLSVALSTALVAVMSCGNDETNKSTVSNGGASGSGGETGKGGTGPSRATGGTTSVTGGSGGGTAQTGGSTGTTAGTAGGGSGGAAGEGTAGEGSGGVAGEGTAGVSGGGGASLYFCASAIAGAAGIGGAGASSGGDVIGGAGGSAPGTNVTEACYGPLMGGEGGRSYSPVKVGECTVSGATSNVSPHGEEPRRAFDGLSGPPPAEASKWLTFWAPIDGTAPVESGDPEVWIQVQLPPAAAAKVVTHYALVSGNDRYRRDPQDWQLLASHDGSAWQVVDTRCRITWPDVDADPPDYDNEQERKRFFRLFFKVATPGAYAYYRLLIGNNAGDRDTIANNGITQIGEVELYAAEP